MSHSKPNWTDLVIMNHGTVYLSRLLLGHLMNAYYTLGYCAKSLYSFSYNSCMRQLTLLLFADKAKSIYNFFLSMYIEISLFLSNRTQFLSPISADDRKFYINHADQHPPRVLGNLNGITY